MEENNPVPPLTQPVPPTIISQTSNTKLIWVLLTLMFLPPLGLILMWVFMKDWPKNVRLITTLIYGGFIMILTLANFYWAFFVVYGDQFQKLKEAKALNEKNMSMISPSPTSNPTTNWKTVTFNKVSLKIPPIYTSGNLGSSAVYAIDPQEIPQTSSYGDFTPAFSLQVMKNKTVDQAKQEFLTQAGYTNKESTMITVDNKPTLKTTQIIPPGQDTKDHHLYAVYIPLDQDLYVFNSFDLHISAEEQQKYFDQILSTFKFTD